MNAGMSEAIATSAFGGSFNAQATATTNSTNLDVPALKDLPPKNTPVQHSQAQ